jgi:two-component system sensor histidine kinase MtrB
MENAHIHGGEISAENGPEGGAVFTLRLPQDPSPPAGEDREGTEDQGKDAKGQV